MLTLAAADTLAGVAQTATTVTCTVFGMELNATTETYKTLDQRQLANAAATIYTAPGSTTTFIKTILLVNTNTTLTQTVQMFTSGTSAADAITPVFTLAAGGSAVYEDGNGWTFYDNFGRTMTTTVPGILSASLTADTANQTSTTEAIVSPVLTVPANYCTAGTTIDFQLAASAAQGATAQTTPGHLFQLRWGGIGGTVIASVGTITPATLLAATALLLDGFIVIRTIGASGTVKAGMTVTDPRGTRIAAGDMTSKNGMSAAGTGVVIDTTTAKDLVITSKTTVADASAIVFGTAGFFVVERP
jgi:hypothetical protein